MLVKNVCGAERTLSQMSWKSRSCERQQLQLQLPWHRPFWLRYGRKAVFNILVSCGLMVDRAYESECHHC